MFDFKGFRKEIGYTQIEMAKLLECKQSNISMLEGTNRNPTEYQLDILITKFGSDKVNKYYMESEKIELFDNMKLNQKGIPLMEDELASCGMPSGFGNALDANKCEKYVFPDLKGCDFAIRTNGRSMINYKYPDKSIPEHSIVACKIQKSRSHIKYGEIYALATQDGIVVKQLEPSNREGFVKCVSFNEEEGYRPYELPIEEIQDWAFVVGIVTIKNLI